MTPFTFDPGITYRIAIEHQTALREEAANEQAARQLSRNDRPLPPTRGPLAALRRRLADGPTFA
jgi:hypothetical protein